MSEELIRKKDALDALMSERKHLLANGQKGAEHILTHHGYNVIDELKPVQSDVPDIYAGELISRQAAQHKINALIDEFETIMKEIRERNVDDSVCGLCEYDGAFITDSGNWCNECPGFERDDCFKLNDQYREEWAGSIKNLPPVQPKRMKGRWLPDNNFAYEMRFVCSVCKESEVVPTIGFTKYKPIWDFCPNCGAKMEG